MPKNVGAKFFLMPNNWWCQIFVSSFLCLCVTTLHFRCRQKSNGLDITCANLRSGSVLEEVSKDGKVTQVE